MENEEVTEAEVSTDTIAGEGAVTDAPAGSGEEASTPPEPASPEFDWDKWDGSDDALPEEGRFWATGARTYITKEYEQRIEEAERARSTYDAILQGMEDPRLKELEDKVAAGEATMQETQQALRAKEEALANLQAAHEELIDTQAQAEVAAFKAKFSELLSDDANKKKLGALMDAKEFESATLEELGNLVTMDEEDRAAVREVLAQEKVSTGFAIRFVMASKQSNEAPAPAPAPPPAPNPSKSIVAGASKGGRPAKAVSGSNKKRPANLEDAKAQVARKYFRN